MGSLNSQKIEGFGYELNTQNNSCYIVRSFLIETFFNIIIQNFPKIYLITQQEKKFLNILNKN